MKKDILTPIAVTLSILGVFKVLEFIPFFVLLGIVVWVFPAVMTLYRSYQEPDARPTHCRGKLDVVEVFMLLLLSPFGFLIYHSKAEYSEKPWSKRDTLFPFLKDYEFRSPIVKKTKTESVESND